MGSPALSRSFEVFGDSCACEVEMKAHFGTLGICAAGAGDQAAAMEAWKGLHIDVELIDGEVRFTARGIVQVRVTERGALDAVLGARDDLALYCPDLHRAFGDEARAATDEKPGQHSPIADDAGMASTRSFGDEAGEIVGLDPDEVHDADVREHARGCPLVDGRGAHAEQLRDLADRQELLDRR